nr:hypothetical protein Iba_chr05cCG7020 [Ipomoea batatas]GMC99470.1 hypothetical protein Iba_chr05eCG6000 [Ipomoea batatas]
MLVMLSSSVKLKEKLLAIGMVMLPQMMCLRYLISISERVKSSNGSGGAKWDYILRKLLTRQMSRRFLMEPTWTTKKTNPKKLVLKRAKEVS